MNEKGLTSEQALDLYKQLGPNTISEKRQFSVIKKVFSEFFGFLNILLVIASLVSYFVGHTTDAVLIILIVTINTAMSVWQEFKAEKTLSELKKLNHTLVRTIRDGKEVLIDSERLVVGDLIHLEVGDKIPADALVMDSYNFEVNESALTGESVPVYKKPDEEEHNIIFSGTIVSAGRAISKVTATGNNTQFGKIAKTLTTITDTDTPLQKQIKALALSLAALAAIISIAIYSIGISLGQDKLTMFLTGISAAVAMVPEGLPSIILITLAVGVKRMAIQRAVVRKLVAIEGLGAVTVICTDKTGTLTEGKMTVSAVWYDGGVHKSVALKQMVRQKYVQKMVDVMLFVNTASLAYKIDHGSVDVLGDPTEGALLLLGRDLGFNPEVHKSTAEIVDEFSFDQNLKTMSVIIKKDGQLIGLVKGSPEHIVNSATHFVRGDEIYAMKESDKNDLTKAYQSLAADGLRVLGLGFKTLTHHKKYQRHEVESETTILGFVGISDPPRSEARNAILTAHKAGIRTVMITGDNELTAMKIARELELAVDGDEVILGKDLEKFSDEELSALLQRVKVFARTNPEDKLRIVKAFQLLGHTVAVTGDGVNDALALKQAEIGIAMGKKGTDVAKEAADIVITDDNYATIVNAIEEGRSIYHNVMKSIRYLVSTNISEVLTILLALIVGLPSPLLPVQILWINLVSDGFPAIALSLDPKDGDLMSRRPRDRNHRLLDAQALAKLAVIGIFVAVMAVIVHWFGLNAFGNETLARTWVFTFLIIAQMIVAFIIKGRSGSSNALLIWAVSVSLLLQAALLFTPALHPIFHIQKPW